MKKLLVCSEFYAGLQPFGATIVNSMRGDDCFGVFVCSPKCDYRKSIIPNDDHYVFLDFPSNRFKGLLHSIYPSQLLKAIEGICKENKIEVIHLLTEDSSLAFHLRKLKKKGAVYYTVHDLFSHEKIYKNALSWLLRTVLVKIRVAHLIKYTDNLVTCNKFQYEWMVNAYKNKNIYFHNFPTLVTQSVKSGNAIVPELVGVKNFILFFGQIEQYKGIDFLYNEYINQPNKTNHWPLVIAGKGHIYFERNLNKEKNVIFINRYIEDEEIKYLFSNAFCAVFPYISGTQSGVLSIPYYLKIPTLVSNIPFFRDLIIEDATSLTFDLNKPGLLMEKIKCMTNRDREKITEAGFLFYQKIYNEEELRNQLLKIYN